MNIRIEALARELGAKSKVNEIRNSGYIPAVVYGPQREAMPIKVEKGTFLRSYKKTIGELVFFDLVVNGKIHTTLIRDKQIHPITREIQHLDFFEVSQDSKISVNIPLRFVGTPVGTEEGGTFEALIRDIPAICLPKDIVEDIEVDVSGLKISDVISVADLKLENIEITIPEEVSIAIVHPPKVEEEVADEEEGVETEAKQAGSESDEEETE